MTNHHMTVAEAAKALGVHPQTIREWVHDGTLVAYQQAGSRAFLIDAAVVARLKERRSKLVQVLFTTSPTKSEKG